MIRTRPGRYWFLALALMALASLMVPRQALAKDSTIAIHIEGPDAAALRNVLLAVVPPGTTVAESDTFNVALTQHGQKLPIGKSLEGDNRDRVLGKVRDAVAAAGMDGALLARVVKEKTQRLVKLVYVSSSKTEAPRDGEVALGPKKSRDDAGKLKTFVESVLSSPSGPEPAKAAEKVAEKAPEKAAPAAAAAPPAESGEKTAATPPPAESAAPASNDSAEGTHQRGSIGSAMVDVEAGVKASGRHFAYNDGFSTNLRSFDAFPVAMLEVNGEAFPFADSKGFIRDVGIIGSYSRSFFLSAAVQSGPNIGATESAFAAGLRVRIRPSGDDGMVLGISDSYAGQSVSFDSSANATIAAQLPSVSCGGNRIAVDARFPLGHFAFLADVGYRVVFDAGSMGSRFRSTGAGGVDAEIGGALAISKAWEVRGLVDYERFFYAFKPNVGDLYIAGGALDQFYGGRLALAYIY